MDMQTALPVEIIDLIVDELGANACEASSRNALRSLALVSFTMCMRAYKHLFEELNLVLFLGRLDDYGLVDNCEKAVERLQDILITGLTFPGLAMVYYIRTVSITILCERLRYLPQTMFAPELSGILQALHGPTHGISTFRLEISQPPIRIFDSPESVSISGSNSFGFGPFFYAALLGLLRSPKLTSLQLVGILLPTNALYGTDLQNLHLEQVIFRDKEPLLQVGHFDQSNIPHPASMTVISGPTYWSTGFFQSISYGDAGITFPPLSSIYITSLTISIADLHTDLNLFTQLQSLKIVVTNISSTSTRRSLPRMLQNFFSPSGRGIRGLGSAVNLTIEIDKNVDKEVHLNTLELDHPQRILFMSICEHIETHLISIVRLRHIRFVFIFKYPSGKARLRGPEEDLIIESKLSAIQELFPRLSASHPSRFSLDAVVDIDSNRLSKSETTVGRKGPVTGWW